MPWRHRPGRGCDTRARAISSCQTSCVFEGFQETTVDGGGSLFVRYGGDGPAVVLLHGHPRTSATWHRVAPCWSARLTVVCADLRGYGRSADPNPARDHSGHSKRAGARHLLNAMTALGHDRFAVAGHDRGSYYALRLALDHPHASRGWRCWTAYRSANTCTGRPPSPPSGGTGSSSPSPTFPSVSSTPTPTAGTAATPSHGRGRTMPSGARPSATPPWSAACWRTTGPASPSTPTTRSGPRRGPRSAASLALWSARDDLEDLYGDPLDIWRRWADDVTGHGIDSGHHVAEEAPEELARALSDFLTLAPR